MLCLFLVLNLFCFLEILPSFAGLFSDDGFSCLVLACLCIFSDFGNHHCMFYASFVKPEMLSALSCSDVGV